MTRKGEQTREAILSTAGTLAARIGLEGLTIGSLASELGMSKSGLYAHFGAKSELQRATLQWVADQFTAHVVRPALAQPRGEPRVRALFQGWLDWIARDHAQTGCLFIAAASELDDRTGPARAQLVEQQRALLELVAGVASAAIGQGDFRRDLDPERFAHQVHGTILAYHHAARLFRDPRAYERARAAFDDLVASARA